MRSSEYAGSGAGVAENERSAAAIEIEVNGRWDALAMSELLVAYHSFLVHHERERWVVHARTPGSNGETLADAVRAIDDWVAGRGVERASYRIDGRLRRLDGSRPE